MHYPIPILMYHNISREKNYQDVHVKDFYNQMKMMKKMGYKAVNLNNMNSKNYKKKFVITFDDAYQDIHAYVMPILKKLDYTATCFFVCNYINKFNYWDINNKNFKKKPLMNDIQLNDWKENNFEVGSHSLDHSNLSNLDESELIFQLSESKKILKDKINIDVESFSYPYGKYNKNIIQFVKKYYRYAVTTKRSRFRFSKFDLFEIPRIPINSETSIFKFYLKIRTFYEDIKYIN
jgi:peptidoglycan/xylan/chitin deacetylase (PgdA/CDA1 family)|tara:strand:+ start:937 stop:1641 length:705 start_codon:yes stop_codon:yes gene_type:complete